MAHPNILYIHSHDTGRYVSPYGFRVPTPNLHALAEEGVTFRQAFTVNPTCSPSRAALLTGQYAHSCGMLGLVNRGFGLEHYSHHLVHVLKRCGYRTILSGLQHIAKSPGAIGYDEIRPEGGQGHVHAGKFLSGRPAEPFFLDVGFFETHRVFPANPCRKTMDFCRPPAIFPDVPQTRRDMADYHASVALLDHKIGMVLNALDASGLRERTLVICTTDHGIAFPGMKCNLTDHGIGVMLIMRGPGVFQGGKVVDAMIAQIDIFPSLCDWLGVAPPDWLQGVSFMPVLRDQASSVRTEVFAEVNYHAAYEPQRCVRTRRWKYIRRFDDRMVPILANCDDGLTKRCLMEHGFPKPAPESLFDLACDPQETNNLIPHGADVSILQDLRRRLLAWMQHTHDPLLTGMVPAPAHVTISDPDAVNPKDRFLSYEALCRKVRHIPFDVRDA